MHLGDFPHLIPFFQSIYIWKFSTHASISPSVALPTHPSSWYYSLAAWFLTDRSQLHGSDTPGLLESGSYSWLLSKCTSCGSCSGQEWRACWVRDGAHSASLSCFHQVIFTFFPCHPSKHCRANYIRGKMSIKIPDKALENGVLLKEPLSSKITALTPPPPSRRGKARENTRLDFRMWCISFWQHISDISFRCLRELLGAFESLPADLQAPPRHLNAKYVHSR